MTAPDPARELLPCPFCGGKAEADQEPDNIHQAPHYIFCWDCDIRTDNYVALEYAEKAWNARTTPAEPRDVETVTLPGHAA